MVPQRMARMAGRNGRGCPGRGRRNGAGRGSIVSAVPAPFSVAAREMTSSEAGGVVAADDGVQQAALSPGSDRPVCPSGA